MYKVALFDDEAIIRHNIIKKIKWQNYGFQIVGEGENGREALDIIEETNPDVIFTDIEMPFINGLELAKIVYNNYPLTKVVLITGFDEFKYAQNAIECNVSKYILKPISSEQLIDILIKLKNELDEIKEEKENIELLRQNYYENLPVLRENFFYGLISKKNNKSDILSKALHLKIDINANYYFCATLSIEKKLINNDKYKIGDNELIEFAIKNTTKDIVCKYNIGYTFLKDDKICIVGIVREKNIDITKNLIHRTLIDIKDSIKKYMNINITLGVGDITTNVEHIYYSYKDSINALNYRFILGNDRIIYLRDLEPKKDFTLKLDENKEEDFINCIKFGSEEETIKLVDDTFDLINKSKASFNEYQIYIIELIYLIAKIFRKFNLNLNELLGRDYSLFNEIYKYDTSDEIKEWFKDICLKSRKSINEGRQSSSKVHIINAKAYIKKNYANSDLSLNTISQYIHISPSYFGALFKEETGDTFSNYLLKVRMDKTKELISTTNLKNYEIAELVGYSDQHYFSYAFKKYFKISPNEYKKTIIKSQGDYSFEK